MLRLNDMQKAFAAALFEPRNDPPRDIAGGPGGPVHRRFSVYRNNVIMSLTEVLEAYFPVTRRLLGDEFFRATTRTFIIEQPPRSPVLSQYGAVLPEFLESFQPVADLPYLADVARLEWMQQRAYHADDIPPLTATDLARVSPADIPQLAFKFHPAAHVMRSPFPIFSIWRTNTFDDVVRPVGADAGDEAVLVSRVGVDVQTMLLPQGHHRFLTALAAGRCISEAAREASAEDTSFKLESAIVILIKLCALSGARLGDESQLSEAEEARSLG